MARCRVVGPGRAGGSFAAALGQVGWAVDLVPRTATPADAAAGVDLVVVATPDRTVAEVAAAIRPGDAVVAHVAGSLGLDVLAPHERRASIHPLMALPDAGVGAGRLRAGGWFAVAGDPIARRVVADLGGRWFEVHDDDRVVYHAAACVAANHLVALLGQVERLAGGIGVPLDAYLDLAQGSLDDVRALGARVALTGPAARGDTDTIARHLHALPRAERTIYEAVVHECQRLATWRS